MGRLRRLAPIRSHWGSSSPDSAMTYHKEAKENTRRQRQREQQHHPPRRQPGLPRQPPGRAQVTLQRGEQRVLEVVGAEPAAAGAAARGAVGGGDAPVAGAVGVRLPPPGRHVGHDISQHHWHVSPGGGRETPARSRSRSRERRRLGAARNGARGPGLEVSRRGRRRRSRTRAGR